MAEVSKRVITCLSNARYILSSKKQHSEKVAKKAGERLDGFGASDLERLLDSLGARLEADSTTLEALELAYVAEQDDDPGILAARDEAAANLGEFLQGTRGFIRRHAADSLSTYGFKTSSPKGRPELLEYAKNALRKLSKGGAPIKGYSGMRLDPLASSQDLSLLVETFSAALKAVQTESRELEDCLVERDRALAIWKDTYQSVSSILSAFYLFAGEDELAHRIRPTRRRLRGEVLIETDEPAESAAADINEEE